MRPAATARSPRRRDTGAEYNSHMPGLLKNTIAWVAQS